MRTYLNDNWQFFRSWTEDILCGKARGEQVRLPHTNMETPFNCFDESIYQFVSGYSRIVHVDGKMGKYLLTFEGVAQQFEVFVNGISCGVHKCGYTAYTVDVTDCLNEGDNLVCVKVDSRESVNQPPFGFVIDYLTYGGIYREVYLDNYVGSYVADAFVKAEPGRPIFVDVTLAQPDSNTRLAVDILDGDEVVASFNYATSDANVNIAERVELQVWSVDCPKLYTLRLTVCGNVWQTSFGVRSARFTKDGFYLNDKKLKLVGLNRHQSFPYVGYAMPESMQRRDAQILKNKLCVNVVRTSHYPQSHYFLDECDRLGLLVITEIPGWQHIGDDEWQQIAQQDVEDMIVQYRNHPSIILWGVRINESNDNDALYTTTNALAHKLDPTRQTCGVRNFTKSHLLEDVYTFNDFNRQGATPHKQVTNVNAPLLTTEYNGHMFPTKNYDDYPHQRTHMWKYANMLDGVFAEKTRCGALGWCLFDYNTHKDFGSGDRICYHGVCDMFRNTKVAAGIFSAFGKEPFLDVAFTPDIGDYPEGGVGDMFVLTNADCVEVYKGDAFVKRYSHADSPFKNLPNPPILVDDLIGDRLTNEDGIAPKYAKMIKQVINAIWNQSAAKQFTLATKLKILRIMKGTKMSIEQLVLLHQKYHSNWGCKSSDLTFKAYKDGQLVAEKTVGSAESWQLRIDASHTTLHEGTTYDVAAVNVVAVDQHGNIAPYISRVVHFRTEGAIQLIGPADVSLVGGTTGTYVKSVGKLGKGTLWIDDKKVDFEIV